MPVKRTAAGNTPPPPLRLVCDCGEPTATGRNFCHDCQLDIDSRSLDLYGSDPDGAIDREALRNRLEDLLQPYARTYDAANSAAAAVLDLFDNLEADLAEAAADAEGSDR